MNISNLLARNARKYPNHEAVITEAERLTYKELHIDVNRLASSLLKKGIRQGDRVVLCMPNTKEFLLTYFAVMRIGAIIVPINAKLTLPEVSYILEHCGAKAFVVHEWLWEELSSLFHSHLIGIKTGAPSLGWMTIDQLLEDGRPDEITCLISEDEEATILYTSGTTGKPKGVIFTYRNILSVAVMMNVEMEMKPSSRILHMMPLSHSAPLHLFLVAGLNVGATHILSSTFTPEKFAQLVEKEKVSHFFGAPVAYLVTLRLPNLEQYNFSSLKYWVYGGAPLSKHEVNLIESSFPTSRLYCVYGLTEAGPSGTLLLADEHKTKSGSIGKRAALGTEIALVNEEGEKVSKGEVGEIVLFGEGNMKGYWSDEKKTREAFINGWLRTGDLAIEDEDEFIWIVDRKKDLIISGGVNVYPKEIEDALIQHPQIAEVAVVGAPHKEWGETVKAFIVATSPFEHVKEECESFLKGKIAAFKIPRLYETIEELPRNATGKILKQQLREFQANRLIHQEGDTNEFF